MQREKSDISAQLAGCTTNTSSSEAVTGPPEPRRLTIHAANTSTELSRTEFPLSCVPITFGRLGLWCSISCVLISVAVWELLCEQHMAHFWLVI